MTAQQEKLLHEVNRHLKAVLSQTAPTVWLTAGEVMQRTGWSREQLRHRRDNRYIKFESIVTSANHKGTKLSYKYDASSIPVKP